VSISLGALLLVVACSLAWGGCDLSSKFLAGKIRPMPLVGLLTAAAVPIFLVWLLIDGVPEVRSSYWMPALASVAFNVGANLAFFVALRSAALSITIPLLSLTPVFTTLLAIPLLGQEPTWLQGLGILLVVAGVFSLHLSAEGPLSPAGVWRSWRGDRSALWMVLATLFWSLTVPLDKMAMEQASGPLHGLVLNVGAAAAVVLVLAAQRRLGELADVRNAPLVFLLGVLASAVALALQLIAIQTVWVGLVETLMRSINSGMAVVFGRLVFGEAITARKVGAVGLVVVGVALILM
jgi:drug/metabolite transporter (DMT)-like permease